MRFMIIISLVKPLVIIRAIEKRSIGTRISLGLVFVVVVVLFGGSSVIFVSCTVFLRLSSFCSKFSLWGSGSRKGLKLMFKIKEKCFYHKFHDFN